MKFQLSLHCFWWLRGSNFHTHIKNSYHSGLHMRAWGPQISSTGGAFWGNMSFSISQKNIPRKRMRPQKAKVIALHAKTWTPSREYKVGPASSYSKNIVKVIHIRRLYKCVALGSTSPKGRGDFTPLITGSGAYPVAGFISPNFGTLQPT